MNTCTAQIGAYPAACCENHENEVKEVAVSTDNRGYNVQWSKNGVPIPGAITFSLKLTAEGRASSKKFLNSFGATERKRRKHYFRKVKK